MIIVYRSCENKKKKTHETQSKHRYRYPMEFIQVCKQLFYFRVRNGIQISMFSICKKSILMFDNQDIIGILYKTYIFSKTRFDCNNNEPRLICIQLKKTWVILIGKKYILDMYNSLTFLQINGGQK